MKVTYLNVVFQETLTKVFLKTIGLIHCVKNVHIRSYSGLYFLAFGLNTEKYEVSLRTEYKCRKIRTLFTQ